jgi:hypothetical protein
MPPGHYKAYVQLFNRNDVTDPSIDYTIRLKRRGQPDKTIPGHVDDINRQQQVLEFDVP